MTIAIDTDQRRRLLRDGFCLFEQVLDGELLDRTRTIADALLDRQPPEHFEQQKSTGSMISVYDDPAFAELVSCPAAIDAWAASASRGRSGGRGSSSASRPTPRRCSGTRTGGAGTTPSATETRCRSSSS